MESNAYASLFDYAVECDMKNNIFKFTYGNRGAVVEASVEGLYYNGVKIANLADYKKCTVERSFQMDSVTLTVLYEDGSQKQPDFSVDFDISLNGIKVSTKKSDIDIRFDGKLLWGEDMENSTFAMCFDRKEQDLRTALGPATSTVDDVIFDRLSGEALCFIGGEQLRLRFDWSERTYRFHVNICENSFGIYVKSNIYQERYGVEYKAINKNSTFSKPPAGWMTWYAVKFDACEKIVLENASFQSKHLKDYGADNVWVDWEWYHKDLLGD